MLSTKSLVLSTQLRVLGTCTSSSANVSDNNPDAAEVSSILYQGSMSGHNASSEFNFQGFSDSSVEWIDYDNDGDLDLFLSGFAGFYGKIIALFTYKTLECHMYNVLYLFLVITDKITIYPYMMFDQKTSTGRAHHALIFMFMIFSAPS